MYCQTALLACLLACSAVAATPEGKQLMPVEEVRPGMKGKAWTAFSGTQPQEIEIEILGVLKNWRPGGDLILARASGPEVEYTGIAAGMSGSPVYVDGKLVGAMAYAWAFAKEPVVGITPIREMFELTTRSPGQGTKPGTDAGMSSEEHVQRAGETGVSWGGDGTAGGMHAIGTPVMVSGIHPVVLKLMEEELSAYNMVVAQSGLAGGEAEAEAALVPGAPLAAQLVSGDAVAGAIGTVTYVEDNKVLGFGHGLFMGGPVDIPMSGAHIHTVLPSLLNSLKFGSPSRVVGAITADGVAGVAGEVGRVPAMIPVDVAVSVGGSAPAEYHFDIMNHDLFTPALVGWTSASSALTEAGAVGNLTIRVTASMGVVGSDGEGREIAFETTLFSVNPALQLGEFLADAVSLVMNNQFEKVEVERVSCRLSVLRERREAIIDELYAATDEVEPGEEVRLTVKLRPYRGKTVTEQISVRVPESLSGDRVSFRVCSAPEMNEWRELATSRRPGPQNLEQLLSYVESAGRGNRLEWTAYVETREAAVEGEVLPSPPESLSRVMKTSRRAGGMSETSLAEISSSFVDTDFVIRGCQTVSLKLSNKKARR